MPNRQLINTGQINGPSFDEYGSGQVISIEQITSFNETGEGQLIAIEQIAETTGSGALITLYQKVTTPSTFFTINGWDVFIYINGLQIPSDQLHGSIEITRRENEAAQMTFTLIPPRGSIDLGSYEGKSVVLNIRTANGLFRAYTGKVNIPDLDLISRKLTISCTDNRKELINSTLANVVSTVGFYSTNIFGTPKDTADELDKRLTTVPYSVNFDTNGYPRVVSLFATPTPNYTITETQAYRDVGRDPKIIIVPRANIVNTINIDYEYRYQRMYKVKAFYTWGVQIGCEFLTKGYSLTRRDMVESAANSTGWPVTNFNAGTAFKGGWYSCGGRYVGFSWVETSGTTVPLTESYRDSTGQIQTRNVIGAGGKQVMQNVVTSYIDHSKEYCDSAGWTSYYRWAQNVSEKYTLTVTAPQSVNRYGTVSQDESSATESSYDSSRWADLSQNVTEPSTNLIHGTTSAYYWDEFSNYQTYLNDISVLLYKAKCTITKAHRENRVIFNTFIKPEIDTYHTVTLDALSSEGTEVYAKGKVYELTHSMDISTGNCNTRIELALSIADGAASNSVLSPPTRPSNTLSISPYFVNLGGYYGGDPSQSDGSWTGFIGNAWVTVPSGGSTNTYRTQYPESFVVDTPKINTVYTDALRLYGAASYSVAIVDDDLTVIL